MPYYEMWKYLASIQPDYGKAVDGFYNFYSNYEIENVKYHYGTISVTDCRKVDNMMQVLTAINSRYRIGRNVDSNLQVLDGYRPAAFFDFADYIHKLCAGDANLIRKFDAALLQLIPFERHTAQYYSSLTNNGATYNKHLLWINYLGIIYKCNGNKQQTTKSFLCFFALIKH